MAIESRHYGLMSRPQEANHARGVRRCLHRPSRAVTPPVQVSTVSSADLVASAPGSGEEEGSRADMAPAKRDQKEISSHKIVERRRRHRINTCIAQLSQAIPAAFSKSVNRKSVSLDGNQHFCLIRGIWALSRTASPRRNREGRAGIGAERGRLTHMACSALVAGSDPDGRVGNYGDSAVGNRPVLPRLDRCGGGDGGAVMSAYRTGDMFAPRQAGPGTGAALSPGNSHRGFEKKNKTAWDLVELEGVNVEAIKRAGHAVLGGDRCGSSRGLSPSPSANLPCLDRSTPRTQTLMGSKDGVSWGEKERDNRHNWIINKTWRSGQSVRRCPFSKVTESNLVKIPRSALIDLGGGITLSVPMGSEEVHGRLTPG
ncbi:hypothetical protein Bbelb_131850 [Branchiostoma belcheri]|nr:hypothetical protein Bbelb_131850 [Branchiostoma belcheri]